jgi:response regulator RpfG family c-di-GMP phosphodiesterase
MALAITAEDFRARILFVDDEQRVLNSMNIMFHHEYDVVLATSGREALEILAAQSIDVIVADHRMPEMGGVEVLTEAHKVSPQSLRILLAGFADLDMVKASFAEGEIFRFLTKPAAPDLLRDAIAEAASAVQHSTPAGAAAPESTRAPDDAAMVDEGPMDAITGDPDLMDAALIDEALMDAALADAALADAALAKASIANEDPLDLLLEDSSSQNVPMPTPGPGAAAAEQQPSSPRPAAPSPGRQASPPSRQVQSPTEPASPPSQPAQSRQAPSARQKAPGPSPSPSPSPTASKPSQPAAAGDERVRAERASRKRLAQGVGVLVLSDDEDVLLAVQQAVRGRLPVYTVTNIVKAIRTLNEHKPGVLLTDVSADKATIQSMTAQLREHMPELVTIAVTPERDMLDMAWLVNHGHIFRFLRKPISAGRCAVCLQAALKHHRTMLKNPELVPRRQRDASETEDTGAVGNVLAKLKSVRRLWGN